MKKTGAQIIVESLKAFGIEQVAGIPGGSILPLYDELNKSTIKHVLVRQEQAAGFIAQGMARSTGKPAVCMATSGPGAMNLLTAIADARCDSVPIIAITGQVNTYLLGTDAFQEADTFGLSFPITKHSVMVKSAEELLTAIPEAFRIACEGRPGPVLIDVPRDIQLAECEVADDYFEKIVENAKKCNCKYVRSRDTSFKPLTRPFLGFVINPKSKYHATTEELSKKCEEIATLLASAKKPVLYCGGGCNSFEAAKEIEKFTSQYKLPIVTSLMGLGCAPRSKDFFIGMLGMHGSYAANVAIHDSDLVIAAGVRFDDRATGIVKEFCPNAKIVHIDIDAAEVDKIVSTNISIVADVESVFSVLAELASEKKITSNEKWVKEIITLKEKTDTLECGRFENSCINPRTFINDVPSLAEKVGIAADDIIVTTDVGQHQMWAAQYYPVEKPRSFLTSGSLGTMGFGLPAAIGAALANPEKRIVCFSGDGSIMMNIQELATLAEQNLAVTVIVFQNGTLGMVYQQQKYLFDKNYSASIFGVNPDLLAIAKGFGIEVVDADTDSEWYKKAFDANRKNKPCFVKCSVSSEENVLPFVPGGKANIDCIRD